MQSRMVCGGGASLRWAPLEVPEATQKRLIAGLSREEGRRAESFHRKADGQRFMISRGWLRELLAGDLVCDPAEVPIVIGASGKPGLRGSELRFSVAHSAGVALYATCWHAEIGVDLEVIRPDVDVNAIAARFFASGDQHALARVPPDQRVETFFQCWTRLEAHAKCAGSGLGGAMHAIEVGVGGSRRVAETGCIVQQVCLRPGFSAAVAVSELLPEV